MQGARSVLVNNGAAKLPNLTPHFCNDEDRESPVFEAPSWSSKHHHKMARFPNIHVSLSIMYPNTAFSDPL